MYRLLPEYRPGSALPSVPKASSVAQAALEDLEAAVPAAELVPAYLRLPQAGAGAPAQTKSERLMYMLAIGSDHGGYALKGRNQKVPGLQTDRL